MQHRYSITCPSFLCAPDDRVGLDGIAGLLQEAAWQHAKALGVAFTEARSEVFWALHRLGVRVHRRPLWGEPIRITTWPSRIQRLYAMREYEIRGDADGGTPAGAEGPLLVEASSAWIVLRARDSRPVPPARHFPEGDLEGEYSIGMPLGKLPAIEEKETAHRLSESRWYQVRPSDTDRNAHVNNTRYAQWFLDETPAILEPLMSGEHPGGAPGAPAAEASAADEPLLLVLTFTAETRIGQEYALIMKSPDMESPRGIAEIHVRDPGQTIGEARCAARLQWVREEPSS